MDTFPTKVRIVLIISHERFLYVCFCLCTHWFEVGGAQLQKGDITRLCSNKDLATFGSKSDDRTIKSDQTTHTHTHTHHPESDQLKKKKLKNKNKKEKDVS